MIFATELTKCPCWQPSSQQVTTTEDETADWKTYRDEKYGFEIKLPQDIIENIEISFPSKEAYDLPPFLVLISFYNEQYEPANSRFGVGIKVYEKTSPFWLEYFKKEYKNSEYITIDGVKGIKLNEFRGMPPRGLGWSNVVYLPKGLEVYEIFFQLLVVPDNKNVEDWQIEQESIFNQMLSTFRFIETPTESVPIINSISPNHGPIGTAIEIRGENFSGFEGDLNAWIENSERIKGIIRTEEGSSSNLIKFTLKSSFCQVDTSYSGLACPDFIYLTPGVYKIYVMPWGQKSNEVIFTVASQ